MKQTVFANTRFLQTVKARLKRKAKKLVSAAKETIARKRGLAVK